MTTNEPQPSQLRALYEAGLALAGDLTLEAVLQRVVDLARELADSTYGALGIFGSNGQIEQFITSGITAQERRRLGPLPHGRGLLGEMRAHPVPLRLADISTHPASVGFPRGHPQMTSFLGVPITYQDSVVGILYLTDKRGVSEFTDQDVALLELFAAQAAAAVEKARLHAEVQQHADQLQELYTAGLALSSDLSIGAVLQRVIDLARELTGATYGALGVLGVDETLEQFITSGLSQQERERIGPLPKGRGLLGEMLRASKPLRLKNMRDHSASVGFPPGHPAMESFLGLPIIHRGQLLGSIYLTNKRGADEFNEGDEGLLVLFAGQAGLAIENARLYTRVQQLAVEEERQRLAREMHDGLAQVLGYVNIKSGAVRRLIEVGRTEDALRELGDLEKAAQSVYADIREEILGLRMLTSAGEGFVAAVRAYVEQFQEQSGIAVAVHVECDERELVWGPDVEVQLIRVVQESLSNVRKHSGVQTAVITIATAQEHTLVAIQDSGTGITQSGQPDSPGPHFGLQIMRERTESLGGSLEVDSEPGKGTTILVRIPRNRLAG